MNMCFENQCFMFGFCVLSHLYGCDQTINIFIIHDSHIYDYVKIEISAKLQISDLIIYDSHTNTVTMN